MACTTILVYGKSDRKSKGIYFLCRKFKIKKYSVCSDKGMKSGNQIFFKTETEALAAGFRPCGHCVPDQYRITT
jgi:methylphosphotriester-DNA--protein-cysteine methyltransferase